MCLFLTIFIQLTKERGKNLQDALHDKYFRGYNAKLGRSYNVSLIRLSSSLRLHCMPNLTINVGYYRTLLHFPFVVLRSSLRGLQVEEPECKAVDTVTSFDLDTYASKPWYVHQQAVTEYNPTEQNYCARAQYTVRDSSTFWGYTVDVSNYAQDVNGTEFGGPLCAYQDDDGVGKLAVAPCFLPKFLAGPYWIVAYEEDEGYALISGGQPTIPSGEDGSCKSGDGVNNSGLWIFSRNQTRDESLITTVRQIAKEKGFDLSVLNNVQQEGCVYPSVGNDDCPKDTQGTFSTVFSGQKDCEWVGNWKSLRCIRHAGKCPVTCGRSDCPE